MTITEAEHDLVPPTAPDTELPAEAGDGGDVLPAPFDDPADGLPPQEIPPLTPRMQLVRGILLMVLIVCGSVIAHVTILSHFQQAASQQQAFADFRSDLANGVAAVSPVDADGNLLAIGTPVARIEIPEIDLDQIVVEGTTSSALFEGPGHRRDTPLPGQQGVSVLLGRRGAYGGPFEAISSLEQGDTITVTTGQGAFEFAVLGVRREGDPLPARLEPGRSRIVLVTASGTRYLPSGVVQVDADLVGESVIGDARPFTFATLPADEKAMAGDTSQLWALALWIQLATALAVGALWAGNRWGRPQAWIVFTPPLLLTGISASSELLRVLPNLL